MSTPDPEAAVGPLATGLVDDAAVFPPGDAALPEAVAAHHTHHASWYGPAIGPLLVRLSDVRSLHALLGDEARLAVGIICPPAASAADVQDAVTLLQRGARAHVTAVEQPWHDRDSLTAMVSMASQHRARVWAEVPAGCTLDGTLARRLDDVTAAGAGAKYRTGGVVPEAFPSERQVARFLLACTSRELPFKLTAGLHHAVRHTAVAEGADGQDLEQHGLVNVMSAVAAGLRGASEDDAVALLSDRRAEHVTEHLAALDEKSVRRLRRSFVSFGCCGVTDPLTDLVTLGLVDRPATKETP